MNMHSTARLLSIVLCAAVMAAPSFAQEGDGPNGDAGQGVCRTDGAWIGSSPGFGITFMAVYNAESHWWGTVELTWIGGDPTFLGFFPDAVSFSEAKGHWERKGRRVFEYTMVSYGLDAAGQPVYIAKNSGWKEMVGGCGASDIEGAIELFAPHQDPFGDDPPVYGCVGPAYGSEMRMRVDPPCEPPPPPTPTPTPPAPTPTATVTPTPIPPTPTATPTPILPTPTATATPLSP